MEYEATYQPGGPEAAVGICFVFGFILFALAINVALIVWPFCRIFSKAGYHWGLGILMLVPIANIIMPFVLAFGDWPILRQQHRMDSLQHTPIDPSSGPPRENFRGR